MSPDIPDVVQALGGRHAVEAGIGRHFVLPPVLVPLGLLFVPMGAVLGLLVTAWLWLVAVAGIGLAAATLLGSRARWLGIDADTLYVVGRDGGTTALLAAVPRATVSLRTPVASWVAVDIAAQRVWVPATVARALGGTARPDAGGTPMSPPPAPTPRPLTSAEASNGVAVSLRRSRVGIAGGIIGATLLLVWLAAGWP